MSALEVLALIPARGGSKSVPRKNLLPLGGKPLIAHTIGHALAAKLITRTIVTTDDEEIAEVARRHGAETPFRRPAEFADDLSTDVEFFRHALLWLAENEGYRPDLVVNLRPPHPVRKPATIDRAIRLFAAHPEADSLRSVRLAEQTPYKMWRIGEDGALLPVATLPGVDEPYNAPRQVLPLVYWQDGYVDITRPATVLEQHSTTGRRIVPFIVAEEAVDIDYPDEIPAAERLVAKVAREAPSADAPEPPPAGPRHPS